MIEIPEMPAALAVSGSVLIRAGSPTTMRGAISATTRAAKAGEPARSSGTAMTPRNRQPKKAAIHSAEFSPQRTTRSPGPMPRRASSAEKRPVSLASSA